MNHLLTPRRISIIGLLAFLSSTVAQTLSAQPPPPKPCRTGPYEKNLMAPGTPACSTAAQPPELDGRTAKRLAKTATTTADHRRVAEYYSDRAATLDATAMAYEKQASELERSPGPKNLVAPGTAARLRTTVKRLRAEAAESRRIADLHRNQAQSPDLQDTANSH